MTVIHAVLYGSDTQTSIAKGRWKDTSAFSGVVRLDAGGDPQLQGILDHFNAVYDETSHPGPHHEVRSSNSAILDLSKRLVPHLLVFRFGGDYWLARGFQPWGQSPSEGKKMVWVVQSEDSADSQSFKDAATVAEELIALAKTETQDAIGTQPVIVSANLPTASFSVAFVNRETLSPGEFGSAAQDYGSAVDSDD